MLSLLSPVLLSQLLGTAFACGLNLYATVAVLGLGSRLGWFAPLPPGLQGLEHTLVIGSAALLFLVEFIVDKLPDIDSLWDALHTAIRPAAAALLAVGAMPGLTVELEIAAAAAAGAVALAAHGAKAGLRLAINASRRRPGRVIVSLTEDVAAVALVVATLRYPAAAVGIATGALGLTLMLGPQLWRAFLFGLRALDARMRRLFGVAGWQQISIMPADLRNLVDPPGIGLAPPRAARAALRGLRPAGSFRNGWLVITAGTPTFVYRSALRPRRLTLPPGPSRVRPGVWADVLEVASEGVQYEVFLLKDGPDPHLALAELPLLAV